jgi:hypothetical protein
MSERVQVLLPENMLSTRVASQYMQTGTVPQRSILTSTGWGCQHRAVRRCLPQSVSQPVVSPAPFSALVVRYVLESTPSLMMPHSYMTNTPAEQVHMHFTRWYLAAAARGSTHKRILLLTCCSPPTMHHWRQRTVQFWNKMATTVDPNTWLTHKAFIANIRLPVWQAGDNDCWAARTY